MNFEAINPATGDLISTHEPHTAAHAMDAVGRAHAVHTEWRSKSVQDRTAPLLVLARMLRARADEFGRLMTLEMGKPLSQGIAEANKCASVCEYYAEYGPAALSPVTAHTDASKSYWTHQPLGVVLGIMPWNFPFWQVVRFAAPTLTAGNAVLLKHAPSVPGCALALEELFSAAGYPDGLFANVFLDIETTGTVIDDPRIRAVSLTGSVRAGQSVASRAGAAIKKCVLELGGSDPSVVLADADLELTVASCALGRLINTGQSCVAAKRFVVVESIREDFEKRLVAAMSETVMGDPLRDETDIGPMARSSRRPPRPGPSVRGVRSQTGLRGHGSGPARSVVSADDSGRRSPGYGSVLRGTLRAGGFDRSSRRRSRCRPYRKRHIVRTRRIRLHDGRRSGRADRRRRTGRGQLLRERDREVGPQATLRRHQTKRIRPGAVSPRNPRVHQH
jgi:hypothetical protein